MTEKFVTIAQLKKLALMSTAHSEAGIAELSQLITDVLEDSQIGFTVTLPAASWNGGAQTIQNEFFLADRRYWYFVCNGFGVKADNITANGEATFHCETALENDLTVNILRLEVETDEQ